MTNPLDPPDVPSDYLNPDWANAGRVHEWKNYIGEEVAAMWDTFTPSQKAALAAHADWEAGNEEWD